MSRGCASTARPVSFRRPIGATILLCALGLTLGCEAAGAGGSCLTHSDCEDESICVADVCRPECRGTSDCPEGLSCYQDVDSGWRCQLPDPVTPLTIDPSEPCMIARPAVSSLVDDFTRVTPEGRPILTNRGGGIGGWVVTPDDTPGAEMVAMPDPRSGILRVEGHGFNDWGAGIVGSLDQQDELLCPVDLSAYSGVRIRLRSPDGPLALYFQLSLPELIPYEFGGVCEGEGCFDAHQAPVFLSGGEEFEEVELTWDQFSQSTMWMHDMKYAFDPSRVSLAHFLVPTREAAPGFAFELERLEWF